VGLINNKVKENYKNVKRWTKKISIFERDILILPINAFKHWFCIMILRPRCILEPAAGKAQIVYCDSMFEKRDFIVEAIRRYLELEL
jgi:Ulp1 family protease